MTAVDVTYGITPQAVRFDFGKITKVPMVKDPSTIDHSVLQGRDAQDQHPISAITGLQEALEKLERTGSNEVVEAKLEEINTSIAQMTDDINKMTEDITDINTDIDGINGNINGINTEIDDVNDDIDDINENISVITVELEKKVEGEALSNSEIADIWNNIMTT